MPGSRSFHRSSPDSETARKSIVEPFHHAVVRVHSRMSKIGINPNFLYLIRIADASLREMTEETFPV